MRRCVFGLAIFCWLAQGAILARDYVSADISNAGPQVLAQLKQTSGLIWWVEAENHLLMLLEDNAPVPDYPSEKLHYVSVEPDPDQLALITLPAPSNLHAFVLAEGGRFAVVQWFPEVQRHKPLRGKGPVGSRDHHHSRVLPFQPNTVLARRFENSPHRPVRAKRAEVQDLVDDLNPRRWFMDVYELHCFNRYTHGPQMEEARDWLVEQFDKISGLEVSTQALVVNRPETSTVHNVIAVMEGTQRPDEWLVIGAHYDSTSENAGLAAPGAEDNASGVAALLEMARVFSRNPPEETLVFIAFAGEEQGLFGSEFHVASLLGSGDDEKVTGVLNMDMIAFTEDDDFDILLETDGSGQFLLDVMEDAARNYTSLRLITSLNPFGSDHVPYLENGMPAVLVIENDWNRYPAYHRSNDTMAWLEMDQGWEVLKMNVAAVGELIR